MPGGHGDQNGEKHQTNIFGWKTTKIKPFKNINKKKNKTYN